LAPTWPRARICDVIKDLPAGATGADLAARLAEQFPAIFPQAERAIYLVNQRTGAGDTLLNDGDQVLMLQILGGG
jgi:molybdopterin converting factor small subunit